MIWGLHLMSYRYIEWHLIQSRKTASTSCTSRYVIAVSLSLCHRDDHGLGKHIFTLESLDGYWSWICIKLSNAYQVIGWVSSYGMSIKLWNDYKVMEWLSSYRMSINLWNWQKPARFKEPGEWVLCQSMWFPSIWYGIMCRILSLLEILSTRSRILHIYQKGDTL